MGLLKFVNIKQGTDSQLRFSSGNTLPLTALPHSMAAFAPQTDSERGRWFYHPKDRSCEGIRLTHQPSPWLGDFSHFVFMPCCGEKINFEPDFRWSSFRPGEAALRPHEMRLRLLRYGADFRLTPTDSGAVMKIAYAFDQTPRFAVLPFDFKGEIRVDEAKRTVYGFTTAKTFNPQNGDFKIYFVFSFDCAIDLSKSEIGDTLANVALRDKAVTVRLATSYLSYEQAFYNLKKESADLTYEQARARAEGAWEAVLSRIAVEGETARKKTFYSCLYRAFLYPTKFYETDETGENYHVDPETNEIKRGVMYTNNGFWDTFRTVYPLYSILAPDTYAEIVDGWLNFYDDTGYLPRWPSPSEGGFMPGTLVEAVIADAVVKGLLPRAQCERALKAMLKNAQVQSDNKKQGRKAIDAYRTLGYVPNDLEKESVNETLDCAYGDFCIAQVARYVGENETAEAFERTSKNYSRVFDRASGFMRGKDSQGRRRDGFSPFDWGGEYTEGSAWQSSFAVQHDIEGLAALYGGRDKLLEKIDALFSAPPTFEIGGYAREIHEMSELAAVDFGQCAISNQPSFHIPYIFSALGDRQKTEYWVEKLVKTAFSDGDDGFPGDEDNGTMACWYIFACLGFYPFCPGKPEYVCSKPLFKKITIRTAAKTFPVLSYEGNIISHFDLTLSFK
ncbi:MAG: GH92 family glycosyl hydrolase [Clostridiales bacterium]|jgi:predicted alpha-1,2-mannosidase|nr:GH92 family glycosyl hydrolase [Clostridiales bacterium]